jgi:isoleucyl-tRNA synthetase
MDELWRILPGRREESVHMALFPRDLDQWKDDALLDRWAALSAVRDQVNLKLEEKRKDKTIAANLSAQVRVGADGSHGAVLKQYADFLPTLFGVSAVELTPGSEVVVDRASGEKCERCWRYVPALSTDQGRTGLCPRCVDALAQPMSL